MKKIFLVFFTAIIVLSMIVTLSVTGCKTTTTETTVATETTSAATTAVPETTAAETTTGEVIELVNWDTWIPDTPDYEWYMGAIAEYEAAHPNIKIIFEQQPSLSMTIMMQTLLAAKAGPDVLGYWPGMNLWPLVDYLVDLKEYLTPEQINEIDDGNKIASYYLYDESQKLLGLPVSANGYFLLQYSKKLFKDAGITFEPSKENRYRMTWDEFLDACEKLKAKGITPIGLGNEGGSMTQWYATTLSQNYFSEEDIKGVYTGTIKANDQKWVDTFTKLLEIQQKGYFNKDGLTLPWNEGLNLVNKGKAAMQPAYWGYNTSWAKDEMKEDYGMMLWPPTINPDNSLSYAVPATVPGREIIPVWSKHPKEAADWIYFLMSKDQYEKYFKITGGFPPRKDFDLSIIEDPIAKLAYEMMVSEKNVIWSTDLLLPPEWFSEMAGLSVSMLMGDITPKEMCDKLEERMKTLEYPWRTGGAE